MTATVHDVELRFRLEVIYFDDKEEQLILGNELFQLEGTCDRFLSDDPAVDGHLHCSVRVAAAAAAVAAVVAAVATCCSGL